VKQKRTTGIFSSEKLLRATLECANISAASHSPLIRRAALESNVNLAQKKGEVNFDS